MSGVISTISNAISSLYATIQREKRAQALQSDLDNMRQEQQLEGEDNNDPISELIVG